MSCVQSGAIHEISKRDHSGDPSRGATDHCQCDVPSFAERALFLRPAGVCGRAGLGAFLLGGLGSLPHPQRRGRPSEIIRHQGENLLLLSLCTLIPVLLYAHTFIQIHKVDAMVSYRVDDDL